MKQNLCLLMYDVNVMCMGQIIKANKNKNNYKVWSIDRTMVCEYRMVTDAEVSIVAAGVAITIEN